MDISQANVIRENRNKISDIPVPYVYDIKTSQAYQGNTFAIQSLARGYKFSGGFKNQIHGGTNYYVNKKRDIINQVVRPNGPVNQFGIPTNVMVVGIGEGSGLTPETVCEDIEDPNFNSYDSVSS